MYYARMPAEFGCYMFKLKDGALVHGQYGDFANPYKDCIKAVWMEERRFYFISYKDVVGHYVL